MATEGNKDQFNEGQWEERSLNVLKGSKIDQEFLAVKQRKRGVTKREMKWDWAKTKPMLLLPEVIIELQDKELKENAILYISKYLIDKREDDPDNYYRAGFLLFNSCCTMTVLLQEVIGFYRKTDDTLNARSIMHLANVLTLFQSVVANNETRQQFVDACIPNYLIPLIQFKSAIAMFDNIRAIALSVIGILCQGGEPKIIQWAIESDVVSVCHTIMDTGSELNKVKREDDPDNYYRAGFLLFNSCCIMTVLLQEVIGFYRKTDDTLNARSIMHLANVLTLFQSVAANNETRQQFVDAYIPNFLIPLIQFKSAIAVFDNIRAIALSVIGILCQGGEPKIIQWAIESDVVSVCHTIMDTGSELNKVDQTKLEAVLSPIIHNEIKKNVGAQAQSKKIPSNGIPIDAGFNSKVSDTADTLLANSIAAETDITDTL